MLVTKGFYHSNGSPCVHLHLAGALNRSTNLLGFKLEAVIDTGFAGFISMPLKEAFPLALPLNGATDIKLADGSTHNRLTAWGRATIADRAKWGEVTLEPNSDELLIGLEFLRNFELALVVTKSQVLLFDDNGEWPEALYPMGDASGVKEPRAQYS